MWVQSPKDTQQANAGNDQLICCIRGALVVAVQLTSSRAGTILLVTLTKVIGMNCSRSRMIAAWYGLGAFLWFFGLTGWLALTRTDYDIATKAISELGAIGAPGMLWMNLGAASVTGLLLAGFTSSVRHEPFMTRSTTVALYAAAAMFALTGLPIEMGADGNPDMASWLTRVHLVPVLIAPLPWLWVVVRLTRISSSAPTTPLRIVSAVSLAMFAVVGVVRFGGLFPEVPGLLQRATIAVFLGWYAASGIVIAFNTRCRVRRAIASE